MYNELPRKVYKTVNGLMNNEIFKKELELIMVVRELQVTYSDDESKQTERFNMATVLVKAEDGKHYKIQVQNDRSELDEDMNDKQYVIKEVDYLDIRMIGGWQKTDVVNGRFCPQSVRNFCPIVAGFNAGTYKVPACVL